jgi:hypothetical protein
MLLAMGGLMVVVVFMAGPGEKRATAARNMGLTIVVLFVLALLFGLVAKRAL